MAFALAMAASVSPLASKLRASAKSLSGPLAAVFSTARELRLPSTAPEGEDQREGEGDQARRPPATFARSGPRRETRESRSARLEA